MCDTLLCVVWHTYLFGWLDHHWQDICIYILIQNYCYPLASPFQTQNCFDVVVGVAKMLNHTHIHCLCTYPYALVEKTLNDIFALFHTQLSCEDQFDYNINFKNELKREGIMETSISQPLLGVDSKGQRHWLLKVYYHNNFTIDSTHEMYP